MLFVLTTILIIILCPSSLGYNEDTVKKRTLNESSTHQGICWGDNIFGAVSLTPTDLNDAKFVITGLYHTVAQYEDGSSKCWGSINNFYGQCSTPSVAYELETAGNEATCYIIDGSILKCEGYNASGQCNVPEDLGAVEEADMFNRHACAIAKIFNTVECWGYNDYGQTEVPPGLVASSINTGYYNTCAITKDGSKVICWGRDNGINEPPQNLGEALSIQVGKSHACAIKNSNKHVVCWGSNQYGQVDVPASLGAVVSLTTGEQHNCAITLSTDSIVCWGNNKFGQCNVPQGISNAALKNISAGAHHTCAWGIPPTKKPSFDPTSSPTSKSTQKILVPIVAATKVPSFDLTKEPAAENPSVDVTFSPSNAVTLLPTTKPTQKTLAPIVAPTKEPSFDPTFEPTAVIFPIVEPTLAPTRRSINCCTKDGVRCTSDPTFCNLNQRVCESRRCGGSWVSLTLDLNN